MRLTLVTPPAGEPISLLEARLQLRLDAAGSPPEHPDDAAVMAFISAVRQHLDGPSGILGRALMTQTWRLDLPGFPPDGAAIPLPLPPLRSVDAIVYLDDTGAPITLPPSSYETVTDDRGPGVVRPPFGGAWPRARAQEDAVRITFTAGYGAASAVPAPLIAAMKLHLEVLYEGWKAKDQQAANRGVPFAYDALVTPYRLAWI